MKVLPIKGTHETHNNTSFLFWRFRHLSYHSWLKQTYDCSVIAYCSNLGNAPDENLIGQKAIELGADEFIFEDLQQTFCENFVYSMLQAELLIKIVIY